MGSGFKTFTSTVLSASDVNNYLMSQAVAYFSSTSARDTAITSPVDGQVCLIGSNDVNEGFYVWNGTAWRKGPGWNAPFGIQAYQTYATNLTLTTASTDYELGGGTSRASFTSVTGRLYKVTVNFYLSNVAGGATVSVSLRNGTTVLNALPPTGSQSGVAQSYNATWVGTIAAGSPALNVVCNSTFGGLVVAGASARGSLIVEDIGASGAPT